MILGFNLKMRHSEVVENIVFYLCAKFNGNRL